MQFSYWGSLIFLDFSTVFYRKSTSFRNGQDLCRPQHGKVSWNLLRILLWYKYYHLEVKLFLIPAASLEWNVFFIVKKNGEFLSLCVGKLWGNFIAVDCLETVLTMGFGGQSAEFSKAYFWELVLERMIYSKQACLFNFTLVKIMEKSIY